MQEWTIPLQQEGAGNRTVAGGKAGGLHQLTKAGFPVPTGFVISTHTFQSLILKAPAVQTAIETTDLRHNPANIQQAIRQLELPDKILDHFWTGASQLLTNTQSDKLILRSSATVEDAADTSFAGIFESILDISTKNGFNQALLKIYAAVFSERAMNYCNHQGIPPEKIKMAVVVQEMIPAEKSGILFTINPITGNDHEMSIEAIHGLGEAIVQGAVTPDAYLYNWMENDISTVRSKQQQQWLQPGTAGLNKLDKHEPVLNQEEILELGEMSLRVQSFYGRPQDIEWAYADNRFYLVQSRPVTAYRITGQEAWTNADFKDGGISSSAATPLMLSLYKHILETSMPQYLRSVKLYPSYEPPAWGSIRFSILYWNASAVKNGVMKIPGFTERQFDEDLGITPDYEGTGRKTGITLRSLFNGIQILLATNRSIKRRPGINEGIIKSVKQVFSEFHQINLQKSEDPELYQFVRHLIEAYEQLETGYFNTIYDNSNCKTLFTEKLEKYNSGKKKKLDYLKLVSGLPTISHLRPVKALWEIKEQMQNQPKALSALQKLDASSLAKMHISGESYPVRPLIDRFLEEYGYHSTHELDMREPHWIEDPLPVFQHLFNILDQPATHHPDHRWEIQNLEFKNELQKTGSRSLKKKLDKHRELLWWREEMRDYSTQMYFALRKVFLELAGRFVQQGKISVSDDIFFLPYQTILKLVSKDKIPDIQTTIVKNRHYYDGFANFPKPNDILPSVDISTEIEEGDGILKGIPCSPGVIQGEISVVSSVENIQDIQEGVILVTRFTDPAWTSVFPLISGLITETGGVLSHGAIVSREYGIPAVLGVKNCTAVLKTGMTVEMNGNSGSVKILDNE